MTKNMSAPLSFLQGLATPSWAGRLFISLIAASSFSADRSPVTPTGLAKWHVPGKTHYRPASLLEWGKVLREGDGADTVKTYKCRCLGSLSLSMDPVSRLWELVYWKLLCPALS